MMAGSDGKSAVAGGLARHIPVLARQVFEQLSHEFAGRLQVAEVAFDEAADSATFTKRFGLTFPVGSSTSDAACTATLALAVAASHVPAPIGQAVSAVW